MIRADLVTDWHPARRVRGQVEYAVCKLLRSLAGAVPADQAIVELGAFCGRSTGWLLLGAQDGHGAHVTTVDPWEQYRGDYYTPEHGYLAARAAFEAHMAAIGATADRHTVIQSTALEAALAWSGPPVGLLWHDAEHSAEAVARDLSAWLPHLAPSATVVLHDAGNPEMGVVRGAARVLDAPGWDWPGELIRWRKRPERRGVLIVRRSS